MRTAPNSADRQRFSGPQPGSAPAPSHPLYARRSADHRHETAPLGPGEVFEGAVIFRQLRHLVQVPTEHLAYHLQTSVETLEALEHGHTAQLPPWPETVRVVTAYTGLANIDPRPILSAIHAAMMARSTHLAAAMMDVRQPPPSPRDASKRAITVDKTHVSLMAWPRAALADLRDGMLSGLAKVWPDAAVQSLKQRRVITALSVTLPLAILLSLGSGGPVSAVASVLPRPVTGFFRSIEDFVLVSMAPRRGGFVWIEVADPRSRKTDKLPSPKR